MVTPDEALHHLDSRSMDETGDCNATTAAFLSSLSHDLRTPMNGILGMAQLLLAADDLAPSHRRRIEVIQRSGEDLLTLIDRHIDRAGAAPALASVGASSGAPESAMAASPVPCRVGPPSVKGGGRDILVAEDDNDMAFLIEDMLDEAGHRVTVASNGASALLALEERSFDLILMDGALPDMTGFEAVRRVRGLPDSRAAIPIIALTGAALAGDRERFLAAGMDDYLAKPVDFNQLVQTIDRCLEAFPIK